MSDKGNIAKEITGKSKESHPNNAAKDIVRNEFAVVHLADTSYKWSKCSDYGNKSGQKDSLAAMFSEKMISLIYMLLVDGNFWVG